MMSDRHPHRTERAQSSVPSIECRACDLFAVCLGLGATGHAAGPLVTHRRPFRRREFLFRAGDRFESIYAISAGVVKTFAELANGERVAAFHFPGEVLGLDSVGGDMHRFSARALAPVQVCELHLPRLASEHPALQQELLGVMGRELLRQRLFIILMQRGSAPARLALFLLNLSFRYRRRGLPAKSFRLYMSYTDLSMFLGLALSTTSRLLARFQREGLISLRRKHLQLHDIGRLCRLAGLGETAGGHSGAYA